MATPNTHFGESRIRKIMQEAKNKDIFFIGAGGIMMSSLALLTKRAGYSTIGSDRVRTALTERLESEDIKIFYGHSEENVGNNCGAVIYTVAISSENPEYSLAQRLGIPCISRADYLGYIMTEYKNRIGIAGMHGKSTCTSMCAQIFLDSANRGKTSVPTIVSGAEYAPMGGAYHIGEQEHFIFEACEYMDSFLDFNPNIAILLNAEMEHVDYFKSIEQIQDSFRSYAALAGENGTVIYNVDDKNIQRSVEGLKTELISFGLSEKADFRAVDIHTDTYPMSFDIIFKNQPFANIEIPATGVHNIYNALAAVAAAHCCSVCVDDIKTGLADFKGAKRRMEYKGDILGAKIYDDYGHHPTEVSATLIGVKNAISGRLVCVFQPHTYSRAAALADKFKTAFDSADLVIMSDIYAAREINSYGISSEKIAKLIGDKAIYGGDIDSTADALIQNIRNGDTVVIMGAGDIYKIYGKLGMER